MTADEIGIGTILYISDYYAQPASTPEREMARYKAYTVTGETPGKWLLACDDGGEYEVNKRTRKLCGRDETRSAYTDQQFKDRLWDRVYRPAIVRLVERASIDQLRAVAAAIGYEVGE